MNRRAFLSAMLGVAALPLPLARANAGHFVLAANSQVGIQHIRRSLLKRLLSARLTRWPNGEPVTLILGPRGCRSSRWLAERVLGMPENMYRAFLLEQVYRGHARPPIQAESEFAAGKLIASVRGSVGAIPAAIRQPGTLIIDIT